MANKIISVKEYADQVNDWQSTLVDDTVNTEEVKFKEPYNLIYKSESLFKDTAKVITGLNDHAFGQLCGRMRMPAAWLTNEFACPPELREMVANWKLQNMPYEDMLIRMRTEGDALIGRAILSDEYTCYNNADFVDALVTALDTSGLEAKIFRADIGDIMRAYVLIDSIDFGADRGQGPDGGDGGGNGGIHPAIYIQNSEIGTGRARVTGGLYRSYCMNGVIYGWKQESAFAVTHRWKTEERMAMYINEAIAVSLNLSEECALAFLKTQESKLEPTKIGDLIDKWAKKYGIVVEAKQQWNALCQVQVNEQGEISQFDAINWLTRVASGWDGAKRREDMEVAAGALVSVEVPRSFQQEATR